MREARDNTARVFNLFHMFRLTGRPFLLLSTNAEKAFDRVAWHFMRAALDHIGLAPNMLSWISSLYSKPSAVRVNEWRSVFHNSEPDETGLPPVPTYFHSDP